MATSGCQPVFASEEMFVYFFLVKFKYRNVNILCMFCCIDVELYRAAL
jgi:hypothetical protein